MAGRLLFVILMCSCHEIQVQALPPPTLTVNPPVITERDSVTLNCQTPSYVSVSHCYFNTVKRQTLGVLSCLKTLTGTELLHMTHQTLPAVVKVKCFYGVKFGDLDFPSPHSDMSTITINTSLPPTLTVNPPVITERDSVTLNCQTPSSVSVSHCFFYALGSETKGFSCLRTLTGTELLLMAHQTLPAVVKVKCYYTVKLGDLDSPSPHSDISSITINSQKPLMSVQHFHGDHIIFTCSLPGSAKQDTRCNLYFGETSRPVQTTTIWKERSSSKQWFCQFTVTIDDFLRHLCFIQLKDASCDYSLGSELNTLSPHSDGYSLTDIVEKESHTTCMKSAFTATTGFPVIRPHSSTPATPVKPRSDNTETESHTLQTMPVFTMTTGLTGSRPRASTPVTPGKGRTVGKRRNAKDRFTSTSLTPVKPASVTADLSTTFSVTSATKTPRNLTSGDKTAEMGIWTLVAVASGCGIIVCVIFMGLLCTKRCECCSQKRSQASITDDFMAMKHFDREELLRAGNDKSYYSVITSVPGADGPTGSENLNRREFQSENDDIYHVYATIPEEPAASSLSKMVYSTLQPH
ncbi:uncharacterized protein LOC121179005 isoform X2 [Toxotes jaculatrix]|uniref:uncharacterized protein LOC121179005 isoform X2 n=1 Tax=Toxotes jaculatrix TaxID=941984 RepID=UPI001B3AD165|nr:uncharacterized protein LOC121179005 isoform X2 [Toxotes jaculatrix]